VFANAVQPELYPDHAAVAHDIHALEHTLATAQRVADQTQSPAQSRPNGSPLPRLGRHERHLI
jgi:hypothetical protein